MADFTRIHIPSNVTLQPHEAEDVLVCPYEVSHVCLSTRLMRHLLKCRRNYEKFLKAKGETPHFMTCRYNMLHQVYTPELLSHERFCPDRTKLISYQIQYYNSKEEPAKLTEEYQSFGTPVLKLPLELDLTAPKNIKLKSQPMRPADTALPTETKPLLEQESYTPEELLLNNELGRYCHLKGKDDFPQLLLRGKTAPKGRYVKLSSHQLPN